MLKRVSVSRRSRSTCTPRIHEAAHRFWNPGLRRVVATATGVPPMGTYMGDFLSVMYSILPPTPQHPPAAT